jgi:glyoxylase-like metal-dependent hydrolase (beta-lactamase superfamily II)
MKIKKIPAGELLTNCYIAMDEETKEAFILDPGGDEELISKELEIIGATKIKFILLTHGHFDHTGAAIALSNKYGVSIYLNIKELTYVEAKDPLFQMKNYDKSKIILVDESTKLSLGKHEIKCIETPGHSLGGVCYLLEDILFSGDTLFAGTIGRTDFIGGNISTLLESVKNKIFTLGDDIKLMPGHEGNSTIGKERTTNPFFNYYNEV